MEPKTSPEVTVVLPTYNERESLPRVIEEIRAALQGARHEIIVVDDNSSDGTGQWVERSAQHNGSLRLVRRLTNPGLGASVLEGFRAARSNKWVVMDADGQHDHSMLSVMCEMLDTHELVIGSRYLAGGGTDGLTPTRWLASRMATWLAKLILNVPLSDPMSGFFGIRREAYSTVSSAVNPRGFKILLELYYRLSRRRREVDYLELPYRFRARLAGESKLNGRVGWQYLQMLLALRREEGWPKSLTKFLFVGALGIVVNCATLWWLAHRVGWHYLVASMPAIQASVVHNFVWHDRWTFKRRRGHARWLVRLASYELTTLAGMVISWTVLAALVGWLQWPLLPANLCGIGAGTLANFAMSKLWVWKQHVGQAPEARL